MRHNAPTPKFPRATATTSIFTPSIYYLLTMNTKRTLTSLLSASVLVLAGCASSPQATTDSPKNPGQPTNITRIAPAVSIPAISTRKMVLTMTGPKHVVESKDWSDFKREWRDTFQDHAKEAGVAFSFTETAPSISTEDGTAILVDVADYRIVGIGARIWFGIMTGNAFIDAKVTYTNLRDGKRLGEQQYNTTSSAGSGIFAKVTPQQVDAIAKNVFLDLKTAK